MKILPPLALAASSGVNDDEMYPPLLGGSVVIMAVDACVDAASGTCEWHAVRRHKLVHNAYCK